MSVPKHTPGPWRVERQNGSSTTSEWIIAGAKPGYLAEVGDCGSGCAKANARLIAAAPELLEALEMAMRRGRIDDSEEAMNQVAAAIAKAKESQP